MRFPWDSAGRPVPWPEEKGGFDPTNPSHRAVRAKVRQAVEGVKA
jgi:hypothetical protein